MKHPPGLLLRLCCALFAAGVVGCCQAIPWRGEGYSDDEKALTRNLRPPADERRLSGLDARARDIERDLGVR